MKYDRQLCANCTHAMLYLHPSPIADPVIEAQIGRLQMCRNCNPNIAGSPVKFIDTANGTEHWLSAAGSHLLIDNTLYDNLSDFLIRAKGVK